MLDIKALLSTFAEDAILQDMADPGRLHHGRDEIRSFLQDYFSGLRDLSVEILTLATSGEKVVGEIEVLATYIAPPYSPEHARPVVLRYVVIDTVRGGLVHHERF